MTVMAVDYGTRRIGLAVGDLTTGLAFPWRNVEVASAAEAVAAIVAAVRERKPATLVVGLPVNLRGEHGPAAVAVQTFIARLRDALPALPIETLDERLTSAQVERTLIEGDVRREKRRESRDRLAAQLLLQNWLDTRAAGALPGAQDD